jgi:hypothetical protein
MGCLPASWIGLAGLSYSLVLYGWRLFFRCKGGNWGNKLIRASKPTMRGLGPSSLACRLNFGANPLFFRLKLMSSDRH